MGNKMATRHCRSAQAKHNVEAREIPETSLSLVWLDASTNPVSNEMVNVQEQLRDYFDIKLFDDEIEMEGHIRELDLAKKVLLIISADMAPYTVSRVYLLCPVTCIFIYSMPHASTTDHDLTIYNYCEGKVQCVPFDQLAKFVLTFRARWQRYMTKEPSIDMFNNNTITNDLSSTCINGTFLNSQLLVDILLGIENSVDDVSQLAELCSKQYTNQPAELKHIKQFSVDYKAEDALRWYTKPIFLYVLLNKALRVHNYELLLYYDFFIRDIQRQLSINQCPSHVIVYRGQLMSTEEVHRLEKSIGELISMNSFLSTTIDRHVAEFYLGEMNSTLSDDDQNEPIPVLFEIEADPSASAGERPFADISPFSEFANVEKEILFMLGSVFRLRSVYRQPHAYIVLMELCDNTKHELWNELDIMKFDFNIGRWASRPPTIRNYTLVLMTMGQIEIAEHILRSILDKHSVRPSHKEQDENDIPACYAHLGQIAWRQNHNKQALRYLKQSLNISHQSNSDQNTFFTRSIVIEIGQVYANKKSYKQALRYYKRALSSIREESNEDSLPMQFGQIYNAIGFVYMNQNKYNLAQRYFEMTLNVFRRNLPAYHIDLGRIHHILCMLYRALKDADRAVEHGEQALEIHLKSLPPNHLSLASAYRQLSLACRSRKEFYRANFYKIKSDAIEHGSATMTTNRLNTNIIEYNCPRCNNPVWIYKIFYCFTGFTCFACMRKMLICQYPEASS